MAQAEQLKQQGNRCFQRGKFRAAMDLYTEAIVLAPGRSIYHSNRALCHAKLHNWEHCRRDCKVALECDALNAKASYLLGTSHRHLLAFDAAVEALETALGSAKKTRQLTFQDDIRTELEHVKTCQWQHEQDQRRRRHHEVTRQLRHVLQAPELANVLEPDKTDALVAYVEHMAECFEKGMYPGEVPEYFTCPISMAVMRDPVTTPNGVSYERRCVEEHLRRNGAIDPLTREQLTLDMLRPNKSLCAAIQDYLENNSWAFEH